MSLNEGDNEYDDDNNEIFVPNRDGIGRYWYKIPDISRLPDLHVYNADPHIRWTREEDRNDNKCECDYFIKFFGLHSLQSVVNYTNQVMESSKYREISFDELLKYLGIRLHMALELKRGGVKSYFSSIPVPNSVLQPMDFEKLHSMTHDRFRRINTAFRVTPKQPATETSVSHCIRLLCILLC